MAKGKLECMNMELASYSLCLLLAILLLLLFKLKKHGDNGLGKRLPPGPSQLPVIGSLHHLLRGPLAHRTLAELARRHDAPLMYLKLGEIPIVVASSPDAAREIMKTHDVRFATRPCFPSMQPMAASGAVGVSLARYGVLWRQLRKICVTELLSAKCVRSFCKIREEEVHRLVAAIATTPPGEPVNLGEHLSAATTDSTVRIMVGGRFEQREEFLQAIQEGSKLATGLNLCDLFPSSTLVSFISRTASRLMAVHRKVLELMEETFREHEERRTATSSLSNGTTTEEDILDVLLRIHREGGLEVPLTMATIKCLIVDLFSGGIETTASTLQWVMSELIRNPRVMHKAQTEVRSRLRGKTTVTDDDMVDLKYVKLVIKETLRLHPALPFILPRECMEECKVMGYDVPKGITVLVNAWAIGRDPKYWDDADVFKPERFEDGKIDFKGTDFQFIPFGAGRRMCPGMALAQANMELMLVALLYHFDWELPGRVLPTELDMTEEMGMTARRKNDIYLCPIVRVPPHVAP
ncbi:hypothetical protein ACP70R_011997 [Stipagrostis hirtigluma subsp. patula]